MELHKSTITVVLVFIFGVSAREEIGNNSLRNLVEQLSPKTERLFHGGNSTNWEAFPYTVSLINTNNYTFAGGAIIGDQYILTTADLIWSTPPEDITVMVNDIVKNVKNVTIRNGYYTTGYIAVLKLDSKFDFSDTRISSIKLQTEDVPLGTNCTLSGIGTAEPPPPTGDVMRYVNVPIVNLTVCKNSWEPMGNVLDEGHMCTGAHGENNQCFPNPGDPLVCDGILTGVASVLNLCDNNDYPGLYGNVAYHREWIESVINQQ